MSQSILFLAPAQAVTGVFPRLKEAGIEAGLAENIKGALAFIKKSKPDVVFSLPRMPGYAVEDLLEAAAEDEAIPPVIIFTDKGSADEAREFMEMGAKDYWLAPLAWEKIEAVVATLESQKVPAAASSLQSGSSLSGSHQAGSHQAGSHQAGQGQTGAMHPDGSMRIIGNHSVIKRVLSLAKKVAPSKATVLIAGESGTGKEMFARFLHNHSDRRDKPFIAINCAALPEHLLESELFGHEKGAFTGAISRKLGKFELANGGTLLLDEISEMELGLQAKLLRVLQEGELDRVGGTETIKVDVRVLATTNRQLEEWVEQGKFRQDLYFRLNVIPLRLPALRERGEDILVLAQFFIDRYAGQYNLPQLKLSREAADWMMQYEWSGNVRELQNLMERAVLLAGAGPITTAHFLLDPDSWDGPIPAGDMETVDVAPADPPDEAPDPAPQTVDVSPDEKGLNLENVLRGQVIPLQELERIMILRGLKHTSGNRTQAAELLGISVRTLRNKLNEYRTQGLEIE